MAFVIADRVRESTTTTGTGTITLAGAVNGFQSFSAGIGNGNSTYYTISDNVTNQWEVGIGTYTSAGSTLSRDTVLASSNSGSLVNFSTGTADVFVTYPSERAVYVNSANTSVTVPALISTNDASISGLTVGKGAGSITTNSVVGLGSLAANTSGLANTAMGSATMASNTTGGYNSAYGRNSLGSNTTGSHNTALGYSSLVLNIVGGNNTAVGDSALLNNTADNNTAVGYQAGYSNTTGTGVTAVGYQSLFSNTSSNNTSVGYQAGYVNTTGTISAFGASVLTANTTGNLNAAFGGSDNVTGSTLGSNTTGGTNNAFGHGAMVLNTTGSSNTAMGHQALRSNTTASNNTAVGYQAGYSNTTATRNTYTGYQSGYTSATGARNSGFGYQALYANTGSDNCAFGDGSLPANTSGASNSAFGGGALNVNTTGSYNVGVGTVSLVANTTGSNNTGIGYFALANNTTASNNTAVGYQAGYSNTTGTQNNSFGGLALFAVTTNSYNNAFGYAALRNNTGQANTAFGDSALSGASGSSTGSSNSAFGASTLVALTTGSNNTGIGQQALQANTTASNNTAVGYQAGYLNVTGDSNTFIGKAAGINTTGGNNTFVGCNAGYGAGYYVTSGTKNTILGGYSGNQGGLDIRTASNYIVLSDGDGNPRQVIDSSGNVGIGTSSPASTLDVRGTSPEIKLVATTGTNGVGYTVNNTGGNFYFGRDSSSGGYFGSGSAYSAVLWSTGAYPMVFATNNTERMRIDSSGNVLVGTSTLNRLGSGASGTAFQLNASGTPEIYISTASVSSGDYVGTINFGTTGTSSATKRSALIASVLTAASGTQVSGNLQFFTTNSGSLNEAMRIDSSGNLLVGTTTRSADLVTFASAGATANQLGLRSTDDQSGNSFIVFRNSAGTGIGSITRVTTTNAVTYNTTSDYRLKTVIGPVADAGQRIDALKPIDYLWTESGQQARGFLAHKFQEVYANSVSGTKDAVDADGKPVYQSMQAGTPEVIADLVAEIQSLRKRLAAAGI